MKAPVKFKVGDKVVLVNAELSRFSSIGNGTTLTITGTDYRYDVPVIRFDGKCHPELDDGSYTARADCVVLESVYKSPLYRNLE